MILSPAPKNRQTKLEENTMKKDLIFAPIMLLVGVALFLLRATGMSAHIALSVVGLAVLIAYTVLTRKSWKLPALEVLLRVCYGLALITGGVLMKVHGVAALAIAHKVFAGVFVVLLVVVFLHKALVKKTG